MDAKTRTTPVALIVGVAALVGSISVACSSAPSAGSGAGLGATSAGSSAPTGTAGPPCPARVTSVVVTVDQWSDLVRALGGGCAKVTTVVAGTTGDPHDYEPSPGDNAKFSGARLVVLNGVGYDAWGDKAIQTLSARPEVLDIGDAVGAHDGDNPHLWYRPAYVATAATALTTKLKAMAPAAADYFDERAVAWREVMRPYDDALAEARAKGAGKRFAATESVFDEMARAIGLSDATPAGYAQAASNGGEPAPGDVNDFQRVLRDKQVDVLIFNPQTQGAIPAQLRSAAEDAGIPVVEVTETVPPGQPGFVAWQVEQLHRLVEALGAPAAPGPR